MHLKVEVFESNYINANFVDGFDHKKAYISTQGPLENTRKDQWKLMMQEDVRVVVMTTKLVCTYIPLSKQLNSCFKLF